MSSAFVKEGDTEQLRDVAPNMASLLIFLRRESGGPVRELGTRFSEKFQREVSDLSDGLSYGLNDNGTWQIYLD